MAKKNSTKTATKEARQASQPRLLTYSQWAGINFDLSPNTWTPDWEHPRTAYEHERQTDLPPNFLHIQNNIELNDNGTLEVRRVGYMEGDTSIEDGQDLWLYPPEGLEFTQCVYYKDDRVYAGFEDGTVRWYDFLEPEAGWRNIDISEYVQADFIGAYDTVTPPRTGFCSGYKYLYPDVRLNLIEQGRIPNRIWTQITSYIVNGEEYLIALGNYPNDYPRHLMSGGTIFICPMKDKTIGYTPWDPDRVPPGPGIHTEETLTWWQRHVPNARDFNSVFSTEDQHAYAPRYVPWGGLINAPACFKKAAWDEDIWNQTHTTDLDTIDDYYYYTNDTAKIPSTPEFDKRDIHIWCDQHWPTEYYNTNTNQWTGIDPAQQKKLFTNDPNKAVDQVVFYATFGNKFGQSPLIPVCSTYVTKPPVEWTMPTQKYDTPSYNPEYHDDAYYVEFSVRLPMCGIEEIEGGQYAFQRWSMYGDIEYVNFYVTQTESTDPVFCCRHVIEKGDYQMVMPDDYPLPSSVSYSGVAYVKDILFRGVNWYGGMQDTDELNDANLKPKKDGDDMRGSLASWCSIVDGRIYYWGVVDKPYRLDIGGRGGWELSSSSSLGGGWVEAEPDYGNEITNVLKWKTTSGASIVTVLCHNNNTNLHKRFNLIETRITINTSNSEQAWMLEEIANVTGGLSRWGSGVWHDGLYVLGRYGLMATTHTMEYNSQLESAKVSQNIDPLFTELPAESWMYASMIGIDNTLYWAFGKPGGVDEELDKIIFCYDMDSKAYWTYTIPCDQQILRLFPIDYVNNQEGIGIICADAIRIIPTTMEGRWGADEILPPGVRPPHAMFQTGELANTVPATGTLYVAQLELHFDYIQGGPVHIDIDGVDYYGRATHVHKIIDVTDPHGYHDYTCYVRVDYYLENYHITVTSDAWWRLTHIIAKVYQTPAKIGIVYGYDAHSGYYDANGHRGRTHSYIKSYNDLRRAIVT